MSEKNDKISVFNFMDYKDYLRAYYDQQKKSRAGFSFRSFSSKAGFGSSNFYKLVMDGDRGLSDDGAKKFAKGLKLNKQETEFFLNLVRFNQAKNHDEKNEAYKKLVGNRKYQKVKPLVKDRYDYYSKWYHPVVREMIAAKNFDGDFKKVALCIKPPLSESQIRESVELLLELGFLKSLGGSCFEQAEPLVTTGPEVRSVILMNYHKDILDLVKNEIEKVPSEDRDVSALTLGVRKDKVSELKMKVQKFRQEIMQYVSDEDDPETVLLLSIQLMPVAERDGS